MTQREKDEAEMLLIAFFLRRYKKLSAEEIKAKEAKLEEITAKFRRKSKRKKQN
jgi:hypothetical protein